MFDEFLRVFSGLLKSIPVTEQDRVDGEFVQTEAQLAALRGKWHVYRPDELDQECTRTGHRYLVDGLLPERSLGLIVGDSGLGKSPLVYQLGICLAAGVPFLGFPTVQTSVLYLDFENGLFEVNRLLKQLSRHLGLSAPPKDLNLWNINNSTPSNSGVALGGGVNIQIWKIRIMDWTGLKAFEIIRDFKPGLVVMDPISAVYPKVEKDNQEATAFYRSAGR